MPITTEVYRRATETVTVMASIDDEGAEIRVIHERDGEVLTDTIPEWGDDPQAGRRWVARHREARLAEGYQLAEETEGPPR
ncbi:hypothetical protein ACWT_5283 [Actinoplanes sp. SE50]|uniref:hypothetical protein n=1 Tax=unclassified Actinoplanes TaxID=2626549 RepID=UPI00023EBF7A|nr:MULTISPECIES: hypothetical protein [unclassified Actinoplanes]AEV86301.1 hypothetical protein ACPL_5414 [Actinoplanes sp. SE50/110]ATO84698.1 hypothetical protein ACWT_5283 [Actinoplanes sp. SE50]SLM02108.1 uncharacterized protein ACSP50_5346 [Actinoplanes sp. SE50/110]